MVDRQRDDGVGAVQEEHRDSRYRRLEPTDVRGPRVSRADFRYGPQSDKPPHHEGLAVVDHRFHAGISSSGQHKAAEEPGSVRSPAAGTPAADRSENAE